MGKGQEFSSFNDFSGKKLLIQIFTWSGFLVPPLSCKQNFTDYILCVVPFGLGRPHTNWKIGNNEKTMPFMF